ncbi:MAG: methionine adenosyltransferase domain-containing protein, partial [Bacteroidota bacterium]|nr:methionine adenosyltransferase domain-containing protein [Bacteroidota bacterium]
AKNLVASGVADEALVQVAYAIGVAEPVGLYVNTFGTSKVDFTDGEIAEKLHDIFDMKPYAIEQRFKLRTPIYSETAAYGHMGRNPKKVTKTFVSPDGVEKTMEVELFPWEKLNYVEKIKSTFNL